MKNVHLLPTDKASRLFIIDGKLYNYHKPQQGDGVNEINQNIYITNSEEIKEVCYVISTYDNWRGDGKLKPQVGKILEIHDDYYLIDSFNGDIDNRWEKGHSKRIILTTDQDLIADGVQAISDEFLEWFVKNPSCESVEVKKRYSDFTVDPFVGYEIIIPQGDVNFFQITVNAFEKSMNLNLEYIEEPKQDSTFENAKLALRNYLLANNEKVTNDLQEMREKSGIDRDETVEEAAETWVFETNGHKWSNNDDTAGDNYGSFKAGATWQAERGYSEEEVEKMVRAAYTFGEKEFKYFGAFKEWFEQFKKK
jgi:hypothetical protein